MILLDLATPFDTKVTADCVIVVAVLSDGDVVTMTSN